MNATLLLAIIRAADENVLELLAEFAVANITSGAVILTQRTEARIVHNHDHGCTLALTYLSISRCSTSVENQ